MKVTIIQPITHDGKLWNVGDTPSVTPELAARLRANGFIADDAADEAAPAPIEEEEEQPVCKHEPTPRKPRKTKN